MKKIIKNVLVFLSYFVYADLMIIIAGGLGFNFYELSTMNRAIFLLLCNIIYIVVLGFIYKDELLKDFKDFKTNYKKYIKTYLIYYMAGVLLMGLSNLIIQALTKTGISGNEESIRNLIEIVPLYMFFSSVIYAPFVEEMIFRKSIKNLVDKKYIFIIASGLIFGILHISDYTDINQVLLGIPYIIMGLDFAYIYYKTNNIFTTMSFHLVHNLLLYIVQIVGGLS